MAGHSKWAKLKHVKGKTDAQKAKTFSKLVRFISVEAKKAKGDRTAPSLRQAIDKARAANMPSDNIDRAVEKASAQGAELEAVVYEAYGPGGSAIIIEGYTDNRNRTVQEIKHILSKNGAAFAAQGAALWAFAKNAEAKTPEGSSPDGSEPFRGKYEPISTVELNDFDMQKLADLVDELEEHDDVSEVYTNAA